MELGHVVDSVLDETQFQQFQESHHLWWIT